MLALGSTCEAVKMPTMATASTRTVVTRMRWLRQTSQPAERPSSESAVSGGVESTACRRFGGLERLRSHFATLQRSLCQVDRGHRDNAG